MSWGPSFGRPILHYDAYFQDYVLASSFPVGLVFKGLGLQVLGVQDIEDGMES